MLSDLGYSKAEITCTMNLVQRESNFRIDARNKTSGAYGLFQFMNIEKNKTLTMKEQVIRYDRYLKTRYKSDACLAYKHALLKGWY
jgi:hypothetical protein